MPGLTDPPAAGEPLGERRTQVLALLRRAAAPVAVQDVAEALALHVNTARFHLDGLVDAGLADRTTEEREQPGRPRVMYTVRIDAAVGPRSFQLLAEILTSLVASSLDDPGPAAREAGRLWGRHLTERPAPYERVGADDAADRLSRTLDAIGFAPEVEPHRDGAEVRLRHCPFREVAQRHPDVVCAVHLGLMQGALQEMRAPLAVDDLRPFVEPTLCLAHLTATGSPVRG